MSTSGLEIIGRSDKPSFPEHLFQEFRAGRIDKDAYEVQTAIWVAENAAKYEFRPYPILSQMVVDYVHGRASGRRETRDPQLSRRVSNWSEAMRSYIEQNTADQELFLWCREKLLSKRLIKHVELLEKKSEEYTNPLPEIITAATRCQEVDWIDRLRGGQ